MIVNNVSYALLTSRLSLFFILLWIANDSLLKSLFHNEVTGKLSDITGLFITPLFLTAITRYLASILKFRFKEISLLIFYMLLTSLLFIAINIDQNLNDLIVKFIWFFYDAKGTADNTDILCLAVFIPLLGLFLRKQKICVSATIFKWKAYIVLPLVSFAILNTSPGKSPDTDAMRLLLFMSLADTKDKITITKPLNGETSKVNQPITFEWKYKNYYGRSEPPAFTYNLKCGESTQFTEQELKDSGKFLGYLVQVSTDKAFAVTQHDFFAENKAMSTSGSILKSGKYFIRIALQYKNHPSCDKSSLTIGNGSDTIELNTID